MNNKKYIQPSDDDVNHIIYEQTNVPSFMMFGIPKDNAKVLTNKVNEAFEDLRINHDHYIDRGIESWASFYVAKIKPITDEPDELLWTTYHFGRIVQDIENQPSTKPSDINDAIMKLMGR